MLDTHCRLLCQTPHTHAKLLTALLVASSVVVVEICRVSEANANVIVNGDFEDLTGWGSPGGINVFPPGWGSISPSVTRNAAGQQSGASAIGGAGTSAFVPRTSQTRRLDQSFTETDQWQLDFDFAVEDAGGPSDRSLTTSIYGSSGDVLITLRINGEGDFQLFDNGGLGWHTPSGLSAAVKMSDDVQLTPLVHHLAIAGNLAEGVPGYTVTVTDSDGNVHQSPVLTDVWNSPAAGPAIGSGITGLSFVAGSAVVGDYLIDNVSLVRVPEPNALGICLLASIGCVRRRK